jgi:2-hydroxy-3-oxopropionate reductase
MKIGFIGLGIMGNPMAKNLLAAGHSLRVFDIVPAAMEPVVAAGAARATSSADAAAKSEIVITMLPNSPDVRAAVLGPKGVAEGAEPGTILVDMSSIAPLVAQEICRELEPRGVKMLDAPVSGGEPKAIDGTLSIMVGGDRETFDRVSEVLKVMGASVVHVGPIGSGNVTKLANQVIVALNIAAMSEALVLATKAGVDPERVYQAIRGGLAGSTVLEAKAPMVLNRNFQPGFRIELHIKDLMNAMDTAHGVGVPLPLCGAVLEMMQALKVAGEGTNDHSGLVRFYERLADIEVTREDSGEG